MEKNFLLVCEGPTDYFVIDGIAETLSQRLGRRIKITPLSPQQDATSGEWPRHGWTAVRNWCRLYGKKTDAQLKKLPASIQKTVQRKNWRALLKIHNASGIVIQMDTDIAEQIQDLPAFDPARQHRKGFCKDATLTWLNETSTPSGIYLALTTYALEAWLLATHQRDSDVFSDLPPGFNFEDITDTEDRLIRLGHPSTTKSGTKRLSKKETNYRSHANRISSNLDSVRSNCVSADELCRYFELSI